VRLAPLALLALALVLLADQAVAFAQSTGGSFGGGSFGGGGSSSSGGGGGGSSSHDDGEGLFWIIAWIVTSRLPWPLKLGLVGVIVGGYAVFKFVQKRKDPPPPPGAP
jgi:uncharacterized membrane protein